MGRYCNPTQTCHVWDYREVKEVKRDGGFSRPKFGPDLFCNCNTSKFSFLCSLVWIKSWMSVVKFALFNSLLSLFMLKRRAVVVWCHCRLHWMDGWMVRIFNSVLSHHWLVYKVADSTVDMSVVTLGLDTGPGTRLGGDWLVSNYTWSHWEHWEHCLPAQHFGNRRKVTQFDVPGIYLTQHLPITYTATIGSDVVLVSTYWPTWFILLHHRYCTTAPVTTRYHQYFIGTTALGLVEGWAD